MYSGTARTEAASTVSRNHLNRLASPLRPTSPSFTLSLFSILSLSLFSLPHTLFRLHLLTTIVELYRTNAGDILPMKFCSSNASSRLNSQLKLFETSGSRLAPRHHLSSPLTPTKLWSAPHCLPSPILATATCRLFEFYSFLSRT